MWAFATKGNRPTEEERFYRVQRKPNRAKWKRKKKKEKEEEYCQQVTWKPEVHLGCVSAPCSE